jgi:hypothetical protein
MPQHITLLLQQIPTPLEVSKSMWKNADLKTLRTAAAMPPLAVAVVLQVVAVAVCQVVRAVKEGPFRAMQAEAITSNVATEVEM